MYYKLTVFAADKTVYHAIVKILEHLPNGVCYLVKVAEKEFSCHGIHIAYKRCEETKLFVSGNYILEEYEGNILE